MIDGRTSSISSGGRAAFVDQRQNQGKAAERPIQFGRTPERSDQQSQQSISALFLHTFIVALLAVH